MNAETLTHFDFNGLPVHAVEHEDDLWMAGEDVGRALEYSDPAQAIRNIFNRNKDELEGYSQQLKLSYQPGGSNSAEGADGVTQRRQVRVFNEEGVMILTMLSSQPKAAQFRAWAVKILKAYRHGQLALESASVREAVLITCIKEARFGNPVATDTLIRRYGYPESIRQEIRGDLQRRALRDPAQVPELVDWFIESFLPRLRDELESGKAGAILEALRARPPSYTAWAEVDDPGATWALRHRPSDLFTFIQPFAQQEGIELDTTSNRFTRWLGYSAPRLKSTGWERVQHSRSKGWEVFRLRLLGGS